MASSPNEGAKKYPIWMCATGPELARVDVACSNAILPKSSLKVGAAPIEHVLEAPDAEPFVVHHLRLDGGVDVLPGDVARAR